MQRMATLPDPQPIRRGHRRYAGLASQPICNGMDMIFPGYVASGLI